MAKRGGDICEEIADVGRTDHFEHCPNVTGGVWVKAHGNRVGKYVARGGRPGAQMIGATLSFLLFRNVFLILGCGHQFLQLIRIIHLDLQDPTVTVGIFVQHLRIFG